MTDTKSLRRWIEAREPLMKCGPMIEFKQRLQWLSEGLLDTHLNDRRYSVVSETEKILYTEYCRLRAGEEKLNEDTST